ncbi:MAG TPA: hypothetical protein VJB39_03795, partial [Patescibacteria group bacterium]|nr:hypothetical protein [Patescibacteria group bacterium]
KEFIKRIVPAAIQQKLPDEQGSVQRLGKAELIDWDNSRCVPSGQGPIYLLDKNPEFAGRLISELEALEYNGIKIVDKVYRKAEIYSGPYFDQAPDLIVDQGKYTHFSGSLGFKQPFEAPQAWKGENEPEGLFLAYGCGIKPQHLDTSILNLTPTILKMFDVPVPEEMDGEIIRLFY